MTSPPPSWWTKTKDLSLAPFVRPPAMYIAELSSVSPEIGCKPETREQTLVQAYDQQPTKRFLKSPMRAKTTNV